MSISIIINIKNMKYEVKVHKLRFSIVPSMSREEG